MSDDTQNLSDKKEPLTREDVERLLEQLGDLWALDLHGANLTKIDLSNLELAGANLSRANLSGADLSGANLRWADLRWAKLYRANLSRANLSGANLGRFNLGRFNGALTWGVTDLSGADLSGADLSGADLSGARLVKTVLTGAKLSGAKLPEHITSQEIVALGGLLETTSKTLRFRIMEEPLTGSNLALVIATLSELHTKFWLTAQGRFEDLINYSITRNAAIAEETALVIGKISHNSPADIEIKLDVSPAGVAEALQQTVDNVLQAKARKKKFELENAELAAEIERKNKALEADLADKDLERKIKEQNHILELQQKQLELKKQLVQAEFDLMNQALDIANKMVELLHPDADAATRAMAAQTYIKNFLELNEAKGLADVVLQLPPASNGSQP